MGLICPNSQKYIKKTLISNFKILKFIKKIKDYNGAKKKSNFYRHLLLVYKGLMKNVFVLIKNYKIT